MASTRVGGVALGVLLAGVTVAMSPVQAELSIATGDTTRELRMRDQIVEAIFDGEPLDLVTAGGQRFLAIHTEAAPGPARGTAVILHGRGLHPDWADVVHPLRVGLTGHGWNTLSIQLPVLDKAATYYDYLPVFPSAIPRIDAAVARARGAGGRVVIVAHSCGSHMAQHWVRARADHVNVAIDGFVGIGMGATDFGQPMQEPFALSLLQMPVLDVYAENDFPAVRRLAPVRRAGLDAGGHPASEQRVVDDAAHYFNDRGDALTAVIAGWLESLWR